MAESMPSSSGTRYAHREQPWLEPTNHKLRSLESISFRNLDVAHVGSSKSHSKPVDDDALPQTSRSPAKIVALREQRELGHSRSSGDLKAVAEEQALQETAEDVIQTSNGSPKALKQRPQSNINDGSPRRPSVKRMRRRSTNDWAHASPGRRQQKLEGMIDERLIDVFFTLHIQGIEEPIYISEVVKSTMNPTFRSIDWTRCGPGITRSDIVTLRIWTLGIRSRTWKQLLQMKVDLSDLQFLGKKLIDTDGQLPTNAVLFCFTDGVYIAQSDSLDGFDTRYRSSALSKSLLSGSGRSKTSSFDALLRLTKLDDSIQDALAVREQLANDLENLIAQHKDALKQRDAVAEAEDRLKTTQYAKRTVEKQLEKARAQQQEKKDSLLARRRLMSQESIRMADEIKYMQDSRHGFPSLTDEHHAKCSAIRSQRRRVCEELQMCYPIEPLQKKTLAFSICNLHLPNSEDLDSEPAEVVSASLGHVAHALQLLSFYLAYTLPYPIAPCGSMSTIYDSVSILKTNASLSSTASARKLRTYPLYSKGVPRFRFDYAVFLLNQNLRLLLESVYNIYVVDIRQTLPNLKYLFFAATAGEGELPARKVGGVRGLLRPASMHRTGSSGSMGSDLSGVTSHTNGKARTAVDRLKELESK